MSETLASGEHLGLLPIERQESPEHRAAAPAVLAHCAPSPHDRPQTMCPAFGALRVGLRMRRTASVLVGSACCVYGLSFTGHFYGARRSIGYVPFDSESLVTGRLFEDLVAAAHELADPERCDALVVLSLCVPTASGVPLRLLPESIDGVRIIGIEVPGFGVQTHAEAKDLLAAAMLRRARQEAEQGPVQAPRGGRSTRPTLTPIGEMFPADPVGIGMLIEPLGLAVGPAVPTREWRELYGALDCVAGAAIHPQYTGVAAELMAAGRPILGSAPVGVEGTAAWLDGLGALLGLPETKVAAAKDRWIPVIRSAIEAAPISGRIVLSGYEGSELLVGRLLVESGADLRYVGTACGATAWSEADRQWLESAGVRVQFRATLEQDLEAVAEHEPDLAIGTTPVVQRAKEAGIPALYFTNLISARPLMGVAGAGSLARVLAAAMEGRSRLSAMDAFFGSHRRRSRFVPKIVKGAGD